MAPNDPEAAGKSENDIKGPIAKEILQRDRKKRRSKSGCRTCRKRRVKCDEGRPICANCVKSKRSCEGYAPLFSFIYPRYPAAAPTFPISDRSQTTSYAQTLGRTPPASTLLPLIRPRPRELHSSDSYYAVDRRPVDFTAHTDTGRAVADLQQPLTLNGISRHPQAIHSVALNTMATASKAQIPASSAGPPILRSIPDAPIHPRTAGNFNAIGEDPRRAGIPLHQDVPVSRGSEMHPAGSSQFSTTQSQDISISDADGPFSRDRDTPSMGSPGIGKTVMTSNHGAISSPLPQTQPRYWEHLNMAQILEDAAVEVQDDDYYDVNSDEEDDLLSIPGAGYVQNTSLYVTSKLPMTTAEVNTGRFKRTSGALEPYYPDLTANPLRNPETTFVFTHFVVSTAPTLSLHDRNLSGLFSENAQMNSLYRQLKLWTEAIPTLALHNSSLLHAILAVSSLQLARVYRTAVTPSLKHYAYSLKRVHQSVSHERKRHEVATLAATLLLAHYEVMQADHMKWSTHLHGAAQLLDEFDHPGIEARMQELTALRGHRDDSPDVIPNVWPRSSASAGLEQEEAWNLKRSHIEAISGVTSVEQPIDGSRYLPSTPNNLQDLRVLQDLCWWYRRQDVSYSLISGNALLQAYSKWSSCPPRGSLGDISNVCATMDFLTLLLGRLANFIVIDRARKLKILENNGGTWPIPQFSSLSLGERQQASRQATGNPRLQPSIPLPNLSFYGMAPTNGSTRMPRAFEARQPTPSSELHKGAVSDDIDLESATFEAECQWGEIHKAFTLFVEALHSGFSPLEVIDAPESAFGPAMSYASYAIADVWMQYYMGLIILARSHPSMPPAAQIAVGVAASQTSVWANNIGRIAAGLMPDSGRTDLPSWHAALMTCTLPLFFAGVQYQDELQRMWTIRRLRDADAATGWASAGLCAHGCESAWVAASQAGRGPPYQRSLIDDNSEDQRVSGKYSHLTGMPPTDPVDRRFVPYDARTRLVWAVGILGTEEDFSRMSLNEAK